MSIGADIRFKFSNNIISNTRSLIASRLLVGNAKKMPHSVGHIYASRLDAKDCKNQVCLFADECVGMNVNFF